MKHQKSAPALKALSYAATAGEWEEYEDRAIGANDPAHGHLSHISGQRIGQDTAFIVALVNAYRAGELVERGKADRLAEALKRVLDASLAFADDDRFSPEEIRYAHESNRNIARAALSECRGEE